MRISSLLQAKGDQVATISPDATIGEVVAALDS